MLCIFGMLVLKEDSEQTESKDYKTFKINMGFCFSVLSTLLKKDLDLKVLFLSIFTTSLYNTQIIDKLKK